MRKPRPRQPPRSHRTEARRACAPRTPQARPRRILAPFGPRCSRRGLPTSVACGGRKSPAARPSWLRAAESAEPRSRPLFSGLAPMPHLSARGRGVSRLAPPGSDCAPSSQHRRRIPPGSARAGSTTISPRRGSDPGASEIAACIPAEERASGPSPEHPARPCDDGPAARGLAKRAVPSAGWSAGGRRPSNQPAELPARESTIETPNAITTCAPRCSHGLFHSPSAVFAF